ncbi:two-component system sensor histidine kinase NtrB [Actinoplanes regularis]|uniref:histidine kinase n=1 Tax=Actinoplanes regularis TaxID=52697 RepID=A0A238W1E5_9ACTN|nr:PAS domain-containing sensor histidine kinase [Actinoplanes regularis]SNR40425.1 PAS domain S-box-containing protein [Actinoplanes regularis]
MRMLGRIRVSTRLFGAFGSVALLLIVMISVAVASSVAQRHASQRASESFALRRDALVAKFRAADFNGWQTAYAFDTIRGVPGATDAAGRMRAKFLASTAAFQEDLARVGARELTAAERQQLTVAENAFDHFMKIDEQIVAGYRTGTPDAVKVSNELVSGEALYWFDQIASAVDQLAVQAEATAAADTAAARTTYTRGLRLQVLVGAICLLITAVLAWLVTRMIAKTARNKAILAAIVEQSADATLALTLDGTITTWNSGAERVYGYTAAEAIGRSVSTLLQPGRTAGLATALTGLAEGRQFQLDEAPRRRKDGSEVFVSTILWPLRDDDGKLIGGAATERDVTARKQRAAAQKIADERAARAARMESLGQLASGVAHDFNNLLAIILNCTELVAEDTGDQVAGDLARIRNAADRAQELTSQLLLFAKREPVQVEIVDLNVVVTDATDLLSRAIGNNITLHCDTCSDALPVRANRGRLDQILLNLVVNARDAMPEGGTVTVTTGTTELSEGPAQTLPAGRYAQLAVSDNGTGMSAEVRDRIFEPFFTTKPVDQGTGLGLATVYGIVSDTGGTIIVDSTLRVGTTFRILLPIAD